MFVVFYLFLLLRIVAAAADHLLATMQPFTAVLSLADRPSIHLLTAPAPASVDQRLLIIHSFIHQPLHSRVMPSKQFFELPQSRQVRRKMHSMPCYKCCAVPHVMPSLHIEPCLSPHSQQNANFTNVQQPIVCFVQAHDVNRGIL